MLWVYLVVPALVVWVVILLLPWRPWRTTETLDSGYPAQRPDLSKVTALIPARNEADLIARTLTALQAQGNGLQIIVIDDQSIDGTGDAVIASGVSNLQIVSGSPLPAGWSGKLWALQQGWTRVKTPYVLLLDADIELKPGILLTLLTKMASDHIQFASLMVSFRFETFWEKVLMPAFIYYFKLLYPFSCANDPGNAKVAAAAGGCILTESKILNELGGFESIKGELIDDCALAKRVKAKGNKTWVGLTHSACSIRPSQRLGMIYRMIARSAFTQLRYSRLLLLALTVLLAEIYWVPLITMFGGGDIARLVAIAAVFAMILSFAPTLKYYNLTRWWALAMPLAATVFLAATWSSAIRYWGGHRSFWKGRAYARAAKLDVE